MLIVLFLGLFTLFLLLVTALYVAAEFATVAAQKARIEVFAEKGSRAARLLLPHISSAHSVDRYVAACQIGITVASLLMGAIAEKHMSAWLVPVLENSLNVAPTTSRTISVVLVMVLFTTLTVLFGEVVPKAIAMRDKEKVALLLTWPMLISLKVFAPFIAVLNGSSNLLLKAFGFPTTAHRHVHSPEELTRLVEHGATSGAIEDDVGDWLSKVLRFEKRTAREVMVPRTNVIAIDIDSSIPEALDLMVHSPYTRYPVYQESEDKIVGILHLKDVCLEMARVNDDKSAAAKVSLKSLATRRKVVFCPSWLGIDVVLDKLREERACMAVLEDEYGGTDGILTLEDLLEEVLGDIEDEFDRPGSELVRNSNGDLVVLGIVPLTELTEQLPDFHADVREVNTVGGLVMHLAGAVPKVNQHFDYNGFTLEVEKMRGHQVWSVLIRRKDEAQ